MSDESRGVEQDISTAAPVTAIDAKRVLCNDREAERRAALLLEFRLLRESLAERQQGMPADESDRIVQELSEAVMDGVVEKARHRFER